MAIQSIFSEFNRELSQRNRGDISHSLHKCLGK